MAITYCESTKTFYLDGCGVTYVFYINEAGYAEHLYWGASIPHDDLRHTRVRRMAWQPSQPGLDNTPSYQEYWPELSFFGTGDYREPTVLVQNEAGDCLSDLLYVGHDILPAKPAMAELPSLEGGKTLVLHLADRFTGFGADLYYTVYDDCGIIARRIVYRAGLAPVRLRRAYSFALPLAGQAYEVLSLYGGWGAERRIQRTLLPHGVVSIDSKWGITSSQMNPFMAVLPKGTTETAGEAYGVSLVYSGSFVLKAQGASCGETLLTGGLQDFNFSWDLAAGEALETPEVVLAYSAEGLGGMSRAFHRAFRSHLINRQYVQSPRPVVINNWEATYFDFDLEKLQRFVDAAADTGVDTFVLDDGWFRAQSNDLCSLGDWTVNTDKLPGGLMPLIDYVHSKGLKFGLWFEPEMISEDSDLFRAHPDYAISVPERSRCYGRHQCVLDLTRREVRDYIVDTVNGILQSHPIDYVKWDCNRPVTEFFSPELPAHRQGEFAHRFALGFYDLFRRIVDANPHIFFEGCSGGGARFDPAILHWFPQIWTSDDSDAEERTRIQYGTSLVYPLSAMSCHVSVCPNHQVLRTTPFVTRGHIAALGATGYELDPTTFTQEERALVGQQVAEYRATQSLILDGDLYRLENPFEGNYFSFLVVSQDKRQGLLTVYRRQAEPLREIKRIRLAGLAPEKRYVIPELDLHATGATLMQVGLVPPFPPERDFLSLRYTLTEE